MGQILSYPADTTPATGDKFLFQDGSTNATKYMTYGTLKDSIVGAAWTSWTPTLANLTLGNGTLTAGYVQKGKTVHARIVIVFGTTSAMGTSPTFTLPVTAATYSGSSGERVVGLTRVLDAGTASYAGHVTLNSTTVASAQIFGTAGTYANNAGLSSTVPMTWTTGDELHIVLTFEAA